MNEELVNNLSRLEDNVYLTRKCRINAAQRLLKWDKIITYINLYYNTFVIIISLVAFLYKSSIELNIILISYAILALAFNFVGTFLQFKERYYKFKENYIQLQSLYQEIKSIRLKREQIDKEIVEKENKYIDLLNNCENHEDIDFYEVLMNDNFWFNKKTKSNNKNGVLQIKSYKVYFKYYRHKVIIIVAIISMIIAPLIIPLIIYFLRQILSLSVN